jgi:polyhydroxyalkanoate synthase subunit PhaC
MLLCDAKCRTRNFFREGPMLEPEILKGIQQKWMSQIQALATTWRADQVPSINDKRFSSEAWSKDRMAGFQAAGYLANCEAMMQMVDALQVDPVAKERVRFAVQQWLDSLSPSNFLATNPDALALFKASSGQSAMQGLQNLITDVVKGRMSQTDESAFEIGKNVGTSTGAVVYENELIQLIQYAPSTARVGERPILLVPPCINKFYILDLQPDNSLVQHLVRNGHTVFMVSWRNVSEAQGKKTWDDYLELGVLEPIVVVKSISKQKTINLLGFCVGGTILATALAALEAMGESPCESLTLLTTFLDFSATGSLGLMVDENFVAYREQTIGHGGLLKGQELATTFSFLRPNDLVWNYVVSNYLKGEAPPAFDLLYWNSDSTNLPGPMYTWYLRNTYLTNQLREPGACTSLSVPIDLSAITAPTYILNTREDHIVPWGGGYQSTQILGGPVRFVLGASGHIAGVVNSAIKNKRSYWVNDHAGSNGVPYPDNATEWLAQATEKPGSWWNDWTQWLESHKGRPKAAPKSMGNTKFKPIEPAPGRYVKERAA